MDVFQSRIFSTSHPRRPGNRLLARVLDWEFSVLPAYVRCLSIAVSVQLLAVGGTLAQEPKQQPGGEPPIVLAQALQSPGQVGRILTERELREQINAWVVGIAAGKLEGTPVRLVEELSRVLDDGNDMQVLPIITRGPSYNVHALLYLRGIDLAVINGDVLESFAKQQRIANINRRINYVTQLFNSELHVLVRPEINSLQDLVGKKVNFNTKGTSAAFTGPIIFDRLRLDIEKTFVPHPIAMREMRQNDKYAAVVFVTGKPVRPLVKIKWPKGFKLLPVPFIDSLVDSYLPTTLTAKDYPELITGTDSIQTVAVPTVLAAFNWSSSNPRYAKVAKFVAYLFERFERLQKPPFHSKWKNVNLAATIPGWRRLPIAQTMLDRMIKQQRLGNIAPGIKALARRQAPGNREQQERLFEAFMAWYNQRKPNQN